MIRKNNYLVASFIVVLFVGFTWIQPWETQMEKLHDEWRACNGKYHGQCRYIGKPFKTNSIEMVVSGLVHGEYDDVTCVRKHGFRNC